MGDWISLADKKRRQTMRDSLVRLTERISSPSKAPKLQVENVASNLPAPQPAHPPQPLQAISAMKTAAVSSDEEQICCICTEVSIADVGRLSCCTHRFCFACILQWKEITNCCPLCKRRFSYISRVNAKDDIVQVVQVRDREQRQVDEGAVWIDPEEQFACAVCGGCGDGEILVLCDGCDGGFHLHCAQPPLTEVPPGDWYCSACIDQRNRWFSRHDRRHRTGRSSAREVRSTRRNFERRYASSPPLALEQHSYESDDGFVVDDDVVEYAESQHDTSADWEVLPVARRKRRNDRINELLAQQHRSTHQDHQADCVVLDDDSTHRPLRRLRRLASEPSPQTSEVIVLDSPKPPDVTYFDQFAFTGRPTAPPARASLQTQLMFTSASPRAVRVVGNVASRNPSAASQQDSVRDDTTNSIVIPESPVRRRYLPVAAAVRSTRPDADETRCPPANGDSFDSLIPETPPSSP